MGSETKNIAKGNTFNKVTYSGLVTMSNNAEIHWETVQNEYPFDDIKKVLSIVFKI
jgi:hypothetical protein